MSNFLSVDEKNANNWGCLSAVRIYRLLLERQESTNGVEDKDELVVGVMQNLMEIQKNVLTVSLMFFAFSQLRAEAAFNCSEIFSPPVRRFTIPSENQAEIKKEIKSGSIVEFSDGVEIKIDRVLSNGTDGVFLIEGGDVLRLSASEFGSSLENFVEGSKALVEKGIPTPNILEYLRRERLIVEYLDVLFTLEDLLKIGTPFSEKRLQILKKEFLEFAKKFKGFSEVADLHVRQIVYVRSRGWMLVDWSNHHKFGKENPFFMVFEPLIFQGIERKTGQPIYNYQSIRQWGGQTEELFR